MDYSMLVIVLMALPLAASLVMAALPSKSVPRGLCEPMHLASLAGVLVLALFLTSQVVISGEAVNAVGLCSTSRSATCSWRSHRHDRVPHRLLLAGLHPPRR